MPEENEATYLKYLRKESVSQEFYIQKKWLLSIKGTNCYQQQSQGILLSWVLPGIY